MRKFVFFIITTLIATLVPACKSPPQAVVIEPEPVPEPVIEVVEVVPEPVLEVMEPEFEIVSIAIIQGELINTLFEAILKVDNPNEFPVELSTIRYELYGNRMFWADGMENGILHIPANSSRETKFRFSMNFINMNRRLLDDVISMRRVQYNFKGDAEVQPVIQRLSPFNMSFDCSGLSEVKQKAN